MLWSGQCRHLTALTAGIVPQVALLHVRAEVDEVRPVGLAGGLGGIEGGRRRERLVVGADAELVAARRAAALGHRGGGQQQQQEGFCMQMKDYNFFQEKVKCKVQLYGPYRQFFWTGAQVAGIRTVLQE